MKGFIRVISAAAMGLAMAGEAMGAPPTPTLIQLNGIFCDVYSITAWRDPVFGGKIDLAVNETDPESTCETFIGQGIVAKIGQTKSASFTGVFNEDPSTIFTYVVTYPLVTGGQWVLYYTTDGVRMKELVQGTYNVISSDAAKKKGGKRVSSVLQR